MNDLLTQNPFAVLTFIVAPAILTNATSVLAMSTINRMLRTRDRMHQLFAESEKPDAGRGEQFLAQVNRVENQALLLLTAFVCLVASRVPSMACAAERTVSRSRATLTPPALPRPPAWTCALTTQTDPPSASAAWTASSALAATRPAGTAMP